MTFEKVYTAIVAKCPQLAPKSTYIIHEWLAKGYDTDKDILPAIAEATKRGTKTIFAFGFFTNTIKRMNEARVKTALKPKEYTQTEKDELRAKNIRFYRDRGLTGTSVGPQDFDWLERYEQRRESV